MVSLTDSDADIGTAVSCIPNDEELLVFLLSVVVIAPDVVIRVVFLLLLQLVLLLLADDEEDEDEVELVFVVVKCCFHIFILDLTQRSCSTVSNATKRHIFTTFLWPGLNTRPIAWLYFIYMYNNNIICIRVLI